MCTAGGLIVAAMATVEYNYFTTRVNHFALKVQAAAARLVEKVVDAQSQKAEARAEGARMKMARRRPPEPYIPVHLAGRHRLADHHLLPAGGDLREERLR